MNDNQFFPIFKINFDYDPEGILKKEKHFQLSVFHADFKYAVKNEIWVTWIFWFPIGLRKVQGKARPARCKFFRPNLMSLEAQDSHTTRTTRRILILLFIVILVQATAQPSSDWCPVLGLFGKFCLRGFIDTLEASVEPEKSTCSDGENGAWITTEKRGRST